MTATDWRARLAAVRPEGGATLMEVCGTHTVTARRSGLHALLPAGVRLLSGPGCPVCVTPIDYIDHAVALSRCPGVTVASYGDLLRVPGTSASLERARAEGGDVRVVYSAIDALALARAEPSQLIAFLGVGFETTAPTTAAAIVEATEQGLGNFAALCAHRVIPPALEALLARPSGAPGSDFRVDGFLAPGHVSTILGLEPYRFIAEEHHRPVVVAGFSAEDMLLGVEWLLRQLSEGRAEVENAYARAVRADGNPTARAMIDRVFGHVDARWRGLGTIPGSGLTIRPELAAHDAAARVEIELEPSREPRGCRCGTVLRGELQPEGCPLFGTECTPLHPVGACMVSTEGSCHAAFRYRSPQRG
jgi:hydrogenase expression/formation protein HypD